MRSSIRMKIRYDREIERELNDLCQGLDILGIEYNDALLTKFRVYLDILFTKKGKLHLLSQRDYKRIARRHFLTSLMVLEQVKGHVRVCDIGTGAGFPSMPLKIVNPQIELTMIEAQGKKVEFLKYLTRMLDFRDINIINKRVEDYFDSAFEVILIKAVGKIKKLKNSINRLLKPDGQAIFYKTFRAEDEISDDLLKDFNIDIKKVYTPLDQSPLALVILRKNM